MVSIPLPWSSWVSQGIWLPIYFSVPFKYHHFLGQSDVKKTGKQTSLDSIGTDHPPRPKQAYHWLHALELCQYGKGISGGNFIIESFLVGCEKGRRREMEEKSNKTFRFGEK